MMFKLRKCVWRKRERRRKREREKEEGESKQGKMLTRVNKGKGHSRVHYVTFQLFYRFETFFKV